LEKLVTIFGNIPIIKIFNYFVLFLPKMSQPIIAYNDAKLKELQTEISNIPGALPYDAQTTPITLNSSSDNHGSVEAFSRGDHTHYVNLSSVIIEPYNLQTTPITLNGSDDNHGSSLTYSRGDHTHYVDLSDASVDLKTPLKITDEDGKIKKYYFKNH
jgi:hypothetical protein